MDEVILNRLSQIINEVKTLSIQSQDLCSTLGNDNLEIAKVTSAKLKSILSRFSTELYNYFNTCQHTDPDQISDFTTHQLEGEGILAELEIKLQERVVKQPVATSNQQGIIRDEHFTYSRLPDLCLPSFSGSLLGWHQFWDQFTSNINRRKLNDVDKLLYLKSALKDEAALLIDGLETTNKNYEIAVAALKKRYGRNDEIIHAHHQALSESKKAERIEDCQSVLDEIERHLRILQSMGENISTNQMKFLIMGKFPTELVYEVKMRMSALGADTVEDIIKQLTLIVSTKEEARRQASKGEVKTEEISQRPYTVETLHVKDITKKEDLPVGRSSKLFKTFKDRQGQGPASDVKHTRRAATKRKFETSSKDKFKRAKRKKLPCIFCQGDHFNASCDKVKTLEERKAKLKDRCFMCFRMGHSIKKCRIRRKCYSCQQYGVHNQALCPQNKAKEEKQHSHAMHVNAKGSTVLQTAIVHVSGPQGVEKPCRILFDCGSQRTYVSQELAKDFNLPVERQDSLAIFTFGSKTPCEIQSPSVLINLTMKDGVKKTLMANVVPTISQGVPCPQKLLGRTPNLEYPLADDSSLSDRVDILLGNDYYYTFISTRKICIGEDLYLVESELGWILSGRTSERPIDRLSVLTYFQSTCDVGLHQPDPPLDNGNIQRLWDLESIGITDSPKVDRDEEAIKHFNNTTEYKDSRYYISWPWNDSPTELPTNFGLAFGRLVNLVKRLDSTTLTSYDNTLREQLEKGVIEQVPMRKVVDHAIHYIPHHGVTAPGKSLRIVYDGSARTKDKKSLNEHLYRGPLLLEDLTGLLIKFRSYAIGLTADVEKAFLQIGIKEDDRDVTRFLWLKDVNGPVDEDNLMHLRFARVPFGIVSSPFILNAVIKHHLAKADEERVQSLAKDIYVDNLVTGANDVKEALNLYHNVKTMFEQISMNLRQWSSNNEEFVKKIKDACPEEVVKVLGLDWHLKEDFLSLRSKREVTTMTKRGILKSTASFYDPCGYAVPHLLPAKLLLQDLWKRKIKWDEPLPLEVKEKWNEIEQGLNLIQDIQIHRPYIKNSEKPREGEYHIHCFTDASMKAYGAVVYVVGKEEKSFVIGKSRLVPIKDQDHLKIPRLELLGVLIGCRLVKYVMQFLNLKVTKQTLWTDSKIVIGWLNSNKLLTPFVSRRIEEIKKKKDLIVRYVPTQLNPADVATKTISLKEDGQRWLQGPSFLLQDPSEWPKNTPGENVLCVGEDPTDHAETQELSEVMEVETDKDNIGMEIDMEDNTLKEIKKIQAEYFKEELDGKETNLSRNLGLFKDIDGVLRCKGRLKYAEWSFDKRYPMIIPKDCEFTNQVIRKTHESNYHVGVNHTLSIIRQSYWIPQGKRQVGKILSKCARCVKHGGGPYKLPITPALPPERVNYSKPFTFTGVDYLGPVLVKTETSTSKRWICLFTCLAVRAVHLEIVEDLSAEEGLMALRRMIATRGVPYLITSDNALHFKLIADIVANTYCVENQIRWRFIPELAPWHGGFYERLVGMVKHCMKRTLKKHLLKDSQLVTIVKEIEAVINTRPLTSVDEEPDHVLKPSDFLQTGRCLTLETANKESSIQGTSTKNSLIQGWKKARIILEEFKEMFRNQYLPSLRERYSHSHKQPRITSKLTPKLGQIVQIKGERNREGWKVGKIVTLSPGSDGLVRVAKVKVGDKVFTRSLAHLYPLEVENDKEQEPQVQIIPTKSRPRDHPPQEFQGPRVNLESLQKDSNDQQKKTLSEDGKDSEVEPAGDLAIVRNKDPSVQNENDNLDHCDKVELGTDLIDRKIPEQYDQTVEEQLVEVAPRRAAAVRALEKIREWTQNLMSIIC